MVIVAAMLSKRKKIAGVLAVLLFLRRRKQRKSRKEKLRSRSWLLWRRDCGQYQKTLPRAGNRRQAFICQLLPPDSSHSSASFSSVQKFDTGPVAIDIFNICQYRPTRAFMLISDWLSNEVCVGLRCGSVHSSQLVPAATDHDGTCPTGTDWQQRDSARHDWLFTLGRLPVTDG